MALGRLTCVECGAVRPQCSSRCMCGSTHVAQSLPNEDTLTWDAAWVHGPLAPDDDVGVAVLATKKRAMARESRERKESRVQAANDAARATREAERAEALRQENERNGYEVMALDRMMANERMRMDAEAGNQ